MMKGTSITALPAYRDAHARPAQRRLKALSAWLHRGVVAILPCRAAMGMAVAIAFAPAFMDFASGSIDFAAEFIDIAAGSIDFAADSIDFATEFIDIAAKFIDFSAEFIDFATFSIDFVAGFIDIVAEFIDLGAMSIGLAAAAYAASHRSELADTGTALAIMRTIGNWSLWMRASSGNLRGFVEMWDDPCSPYGSISALRWMKGSLSPRARPPPLPLSWCAWPRGPPCQPTGRSWPRMKFESSEP